MEPASRAIGAGVARFLHTEEVTGSIPVSPTTDGVVPEKAAHEKATVNKTSASVVVSSALLALNGAFWLVITGVVVATRPETHWLVHAVFLGAVITFAALALGVKRRIRFALPVSLAVCVAVAVLSVTDQMGPADFVSLGLSLGACVAVAIAMVARSREA